MAKNFETLYLDVCLRQKRTAEDLARVELLSTLWRDYQARVGALDAFSAVGLGTQTLVAIGQIISQLSRKNNDFCLSHPEINWDVLATLQHANDATLTQELADALDCLVAAIEEPNKGFLYELNERLFWQASVKQYLEKLTATEYRLFYLQLSLQAFCRDLYAVQIDGLSGEIEDDYGNLQNLMRFDAAGDSESFMLLKQKVDAYVDSINELAPPAKGQKKQSSQQNQGVAFPGSAVLAGGQSDRISLDIENDFQELFKALPKGAEINKQFLEVQSKYFDYWLTYQSWWLINAFQSAATLDDFLDQVDQQLDFQSSSAGDRFGEVDKIVGRFAGPEIFNKLTKKVNGQYEALMDLLSEICRIMPVRSHVDEHEAKQELKARIDEIVGVYGEKNLKDYSVDNKLTSIVEALAKMIDDTVVKSRKALKAMPLDNHLDLTYWRVTPAERAQKIAAQSNSANVGKKGKQVKQRKQKSKGDPQTKMTSGVPHVAPISAEEYIDNLSQVMNVGLNPLQAQYLEKQVAVLRYFSDQFVDEYQLKGELQPSLIRMMANLYGLIAVGEIACVLERQLLLSEKSRAVLRNFAETRNAIIHAADTAQGRDALWRFLGLDHRSADNANATSHHREDALIACGDEVAALCQAVCDSSDIDQALSGIFDQWVSMPVGHALAGGVAVLGQSKISAVAGLFTGGVLVGSGSRSSLIMMDNLSRNVSSALDDFEGNESQADHAAMLACTWIGEAAKKINENSYPHLRTLLRHPEWQPLGMRLQQASDIRLKYCHNLGENFSQQKIGSQSRARTLIQTFQQGLGVTAQYPQGVFEACAQSSQSRTASRDPEVGDIFYSSLQQIMNILVKNGKKLSKCERLSNDKSSENMLKAHVKSYEEQPSMPSPLSVAIPLSPKEIRAICVRHHVLSPTVEEILKKACGAPAHVQVPDWNIDAALMSMTLSTPSPKSSSSTSSVFSSNPSTTSSAALFSPKPGKKGASWCSSSLKNLPADAFHSPPPMGPPSKTCWSTGQHHDAAQKRCREEVPEKCTYAANMFSSGVLTGDDTAYDDIFSKKRKPNA